MGVEYFPFNIDKLEYFDSWKVGGVNPKGWEAQQAVSGAILYCLIGPSLLNKTEVWGRWAGDRIKVVTDTGNDLDNAVDISGIIRRVLEEDK